MRTLIIALLVIAGTKVEADNKDVLEEAIDKVSANVVFMRHALAPGFGDPDNFSLSDCAKQRNLDKEGRRQARIIGKAIQESRVQFVAILSSEWCRCMETTELLGLGQWSTFSGLNSFFQDYADKNNTLSKLQLKLDKIEYGITLMITHQVVINAVTGLTVGSGELVAYNSVTRMKKVIRLD